MEAFMVDHAGLKALLEFQHADNAAQLQNATQTQQFWQKVLIQKLNGSMILIMLLL